MKHICKKTISYMALSAFITAQAAAQNIIDVHCHNVLPCHTEVLEKHDAALDEGFPLPAWDAESHLAFMDSAGIGCSVLTMPAPQPYFGDNQECRETIRRYNEYCAGLKAAHPGRFLFCAALPLPDVEAAIAEAVYALDTLGADGVKLATNSHGQYLGDKELDPLMEVLDKREAVVVLHPHKPVPVNDELMAAVPLAAYEYPAETTRALINMLARNIPARYPGLKVVVPHCGSFLPQALPRIKALAPALQAKGMMGEIDFEANLSQFYYDLAGAASPSTIRAMLAITSPGHILYGSDYPYQPADVLTGKLRQLEKELSADKQLASYKEMFLWQNAARLFAVQPSERTVDEERNALPEAGINVPDSAANTSQGMLVRISEIEVYPEYINQYLSMALEVGATSVHEEPGVIAIFPMVQQHDSCQIRILEIYASQEAYKHHIGTKHFQTYKQGTLHMVKSLDLVDMQPMNPSAMPEIFLKMKRGK